MQFGPGFAFTFFYYFVTTTIITTIVAANVTHFSLTSGLPQQIGVVFGLMIGGVGGYLHRTTSFSISSSKAQQLFVNLEQILAELGYERQDEENFRESEITCYKRSGIQSMVSGPVYLQLENRQMTIAARSIQLKQIQQQLDEFK